MKQFEKSFSKQYSNAKSLDPKAWAESKNFSNQNSL